MHETALETLFVQYSADADASGCDLNRRRGLLTSSASLSFDVSVTPDPTTSSSDLSNDISSTISSSVRDGSFTSALIAAASSTGYNGTLDVATIGITGVTLIEVNSDDDDDDTVVLDSTVIIAVACTVKPFLTAFTIVAACALLA